MQYQYWRIEENRYACYDIHDSQGRYLTTYDVNLDCPQPPPYTWAQHIALKNWATPEIVAELASIERAYLGIPEPLPMVHISAPSPVHGCTYLDLLRLRAAGKA